MTKDNLLNEARRLHEMGAAIIWLHPKSKRPVANGWTSGPRATWDELRKSYVKGYNVGVRLGEASKIGKNYLWCFDVDIKDQAFKPKALAKLKEILGGVKCPTVWSGAGSGSMHLYGVGPNPFKMITILKEKGLGEICAYSTGRQMVLAPSIHPDTGKPYKWADAPMRAEDLPALDVPAIVNITTPEAAPTSTKAKADNILSEADKRAGEKFEVVAVEIDWLPGLSDKMRAMIKTGEGVADRSAMLMPACVALLHAGLARNEVLSVLVDKNNYLGLCAYEHAKTNDPVKAARWVWNYTLKKVMSEQSAQALFSEPIEASRELTPKELENETLLPTLAHWTEDLEINKNDKYCATLRNTVLILEHVGDGKPFIKRDLFAYRDFYAVNTPWSGKKDNALVDEDLGLIKLWLSNHYGFEPNDNNIGTALSILANRNAFDPVIDWLEGLEPWDEVPRLDGWLKNHFNAKGNEEYLAQVFRKWLVAMVLRIQKPGAKFDWMPIFEGAQGIGKSSFGRLLVGDKYFLDWLPDLNNKDSALALQGVWAVEMGELASLRKNEIETVKAYISRTIDKVRPPYGQRWLESLRRCVFFGTTNFETYLRDDSGNRRFKPLLVGNLDFAALAEDRSQLFAEALWLLKNGFENEESINELTGEAKQYEHQIQAEKMVDDESVLMRDNLIVWAQKELKKHARERVNFKRIRVADLFEKTNPKLIGIGAGASPLESWKYDSRGVQMASKALKSLGGIKHKIMGVRYWELDLDRLGAWFD